MFSHPNGDTYNTFESIVLLIWTRIEKLERENDAGKIVF